MGLDRISVGVVKCDAMLHNLLIFLDVIHLQYLMLDGYLHRGRLWVLAVEVYIPHVLEWGII